ncbi:MAG TPA: hypothetical protein VGR31_13325 [Planctomycetota bacterium]|jgi:Ca-activated chloride channel family protein|nr:hypothetical protein [Planctomycetota bacterium]
MKTLLVVAFVLAQAPVPDWHGTLADGLAEVQRLSDAQKPDEALAVTDQLLAPGRFARWREDASAHPGWKRTLVEAADPVFAAVGLSDLTPAARAAIHQARGVVLAHAARRSEANESFEKARALAGPGELRLDATYDLGWTALADGEEFRAQIPELGGPAAAPQAAAAQQAPGAPGTPEKPDPLELARAAYLRAREHFVERMKADWRDEDTRANVELVQKRLRELAEIQKKREEQKKQQEQDQKDQQQKDQDKKDQDQKDKDKKDPQKQDKPSDEKDRDQKKPDDQKNPDEKPKDEKKPEDTPKDQPSDAEKQDKDKKEAQPQPAKEQALTKEEVMRILDTLKEREEEGKKLLDQLRRSRRAKVKKDW